MVAPKRTTSISVPADTVSAVRQIQEELREQYTRLGALDELIEYANAHVPEFTAVCALLGPIVDGLETLVKDLHRELKAMEGE